MLTLALAHASSFLLAPAPARRCTVHQSWTPRARVLLSENTEREAKAAAADAETLREMVREMAQAEEALQQQYIELEMRYAGATERLRVRDEQLVDLQVAQPNLTPPPSLTRGCRRKPGLVLTPQPRSWPLARRRSTL